MTRTEYALAGETLYSHTLDNGLRFRFIPKPGFAKSFAFFATEYGGAMRRFKLRGELLDTPAGVAHYLEHKMFDMPDGNALATLSANGASPNAFTSSGMTAYHFSCTSGFEENLRCLLTFVSTPYFTPESVEKERGIIGQEIAMYDDSPGFSGYYGLLRLLYATHPVRDSVAGTAASIAEITAETLNSCHEAFYAPSNMTLCVVGDQDPERVLETAREILPAEKAPVPEPDFGEADGKDPAESLHTAAMAVSAPQFMLGAALKAPSGGTELLRHRLLTKVALRCLIGRSSPFYTGLYAEGLLKGDFGYETDYTAGTATFIAEGESAEPQKVLERLSAAVAAVERGGLDEAVFKRALRATYGAALRGLDSLDDLCYDMAQGAFGGYSPLEAFELTKLLRAEDCAGFITSALRPERLALSVITPSATKG